MCRVTSDTIGFRQSELELRGGVGHHWDWARVTVSMAAELGALTVFQGALPDGSARTSVGPTGALVAELRVHLIGPVDLLVGGHGGGALLKKSQGVTPVMRAGASAGLAIAF